MPTKTIPINPADHGRRFEFKTTVPADRATAFDEFLTRFRAAAVAVGCPTPTVRVVGRSPRGNRTAIAVTVPAGLDAKKVIASLKEVLPCSL